MTETDRPRRRDARDNRAAILDAAIQHLAADPAASLGAIAVAAGLTRRAVYGHFEDREALVAAVIAQGARRFNDIAADISAECGEPRVSLARLAARLWREAAHLRAAASLALDAAHIRTTAAAISPLRDVILEIVTRGCEADAFRRDLAPADIARLIEETVRGVLTGELGEHPTSLDLVVRGVLSIAGLSWRETDGLIRTHPEVRMEESCA